MRQMKYKVFMYHINSYTNIYIYTYISYIYIYKHNQSNENIYHFVRLTEFVV